ncbi:twin-arginine translocation signal domain-containing protein [Geminicoccaceae bacterium 1502E]|nr:twin-arginine translocation signal domain-containing protein [Geminicoccaceae bacterium 1502E]
MERDSDKQTRARRNFLKLASLGAAASTVAAVAGRPAEAADPAAAKAHGSYRETPHVRKYYELARF